MAKLCDHITTRSPIKKEISAVTDFPLLETINDPTALRQLDEKELPQLAQELRDFMVQSVSKTGGHLSSSLGAIELSIALHRVFNTPDDRLIWDVGHQAYAHKILTGRREQMGTLRQKDGLSGFPKRSESEYDEFGTGHSSTSISAALGMAIAAKLEGHKDRWHIAVIGDGALTGGMAIEALNDAGFYKQDVKLLIILNDNDCSISPPVGALSTHLARMVSTRAYLEAREISKKMLKPVPGLWNIAKRMEQQAISFMSPPSSLFSNFDLNYYGPINGHDIHSLIEVLTNLKQNNCPCVLHIVTQKGHGYERAERDPTTYHGVGKFDPSVGIVSSGTPSAPTYTQVFSQWIEEKAKADSRLYAITPAMREGSGLVNFEKMFPDRYRDVSIAEQHAVTFAAGLACETVRPVVAIYSTFMQRAMDQIIHDVALQNLPVLFAVDRGGLVGADGATHHGFFDIAFLRSIPNMTVMTPSDENECRLMLNTGYELGTPASVRYPRGKGPGVLPVAELSETIPIGKARQLRHGERVALLGFGSMTNRLSAVADTLNATLYDMRFVKPIDKDVIKRVARDYELIVTAEEGVLMGGAGSAVLEVLADEGLTTPVLRLGLPDEFIEQGTQEELLDQAGLSVETMIDKIQARLAQH